MYQTPGSTEPQPVSSSQRITLVIKNIGELVTMSGPCPRVGRDMTDLCIVENAAVAISEDTILYAGPASGLESEIGDCQEANIIDANGKSVIPGLVDPHVHLIFAGDRAFELDMKLQGMSYLDILKQGGGILHTVKETRKASKTRLFWEAWDRLDNMLHYGTTTSEAKTGYGLNKEDEVRSLIVIQELDDAHPVDLVPTFLGAHAIPPEFDSGSDYIDYILDNVLPVVSSGGLAKFCDVFCEKDVFSGEDARRLLLRAKGLGLTPKIHADEIENIGGSLVAAEVGAITADHLEKSGDKDIESLKKAGVIGVLLPGTPYALMDDHYPRAREMIDTNLPIALATDLNPNCYTESMQLMISLACHKMRMRPAEALAASTINAAAAIGMEDKVGSIEPGKKADLVILRGSSYQTIPYHFGVNNVDSVVKAGELVLFEGRNMV